MFASCGDGIVSSLYVDLNCVQYVLFVTEVRFCAFNILISVAISGVLL